MQAGRRELISTISLCVGGGLFLLGFLWPSIADNFQLTPERDMLYVVLVMLQIVGAVVFVLIGLGVRLFARKSTAIVQAAEPAAAPLASSTEKDFFFWRRATIVGIVLWFPLIFSAAIGGAFSPGGYVIGYSILFALPVAIVCLVVSIRRRATNLASSIFLLKIPFYYAFGLIALSFLASLATSK
jgi:hypothetical protein